MLIKKATATATTNTAKHTRKFVRLAAGGHVLFIILGMLVYSSVSNEKTGLTFIDYDAA